MSVTTRVTATDVPPRAEDILAFKEHERFLLIQHGRRVAPLAMAVVACTVIAAWITSAFTKALTYTLEMEAAPLAV